MREVRLEVLADPPDQELGDADEQGPDREAELVGAEQLESQVDRLPGRALHAVQAARSTVYELPERPERAVLVH